MPTIVKHGQLFSHPAVKSLQAGKIEYEYMHPKLSKSHGINMLCTWHQIEIENICAFGDADNDADPYFLRFPAKLRLPHQQENMVSYLRTRHLRTGIQFSGIAYLDY